jgi:hypothetical protein
MRSLRLLFGEYIIKKKIRSRKELSQVGERLWECSPAGGMK